MVRQHAHEFIAAPVPEAVQGMVLGLNGRIGLADRVLLGFYGLSHLPALESPHGLPSDARLECGAGFGTPCHFVFRMAFLPQTRYGWDRALRGVVGLGRVATFMRAVDSSPNKPAAPNPAIASRSQVERHRGGVGEPERWAVRMQHTTSQHT